MRAAAVLVAVVMVTLAGSPPAARADGDPASDVLIAQNSFLPWDSGASPGQQRELGAVLAAATHAGYPIRIAVIASPSDLGSVTALWRQPGHYARFLEQELALAYDGRVLAVMPDGLGLASSKPLSAGERTAFAESSGLPIARSRLAGIAIETVVKLASASGHQLPRSALGSAAAATPPASSTTGPVGYATLAIGALLIALAWAASLRARPPRIERNREAV